MKKEGVSDISASVRARLLNISRERREEFQSLLTRYAAERFLYRLSQAAEGQSFTLKEATLFALWTGDIHRPTRDLDLLGYGDPRISRIVDVFTAICKEDPTCYPPTVCCFSFAAVKMAKATNVASILLSKLAAVIA